jgi:malate permease and related proteins
MIVIGEQLLILGILVLIGIIGTYAKVLNKEVSSSLTKVIMKITLPLLIFSTFAGKTMDKEILSNGILVFIFGFLSIGLLYVFASVVAKITKLNEQRKVLHQVQTMFGNIVFIGFPLLDSLFPGGEGLIYASIFQVAHGTLMWTVGVFMLSKKSEQESTHKKNVLLNPITIAFVSGIIIMVLPFKIPEVIILPMAKLGHTTIYISMLYIGYVLYNAPFKQIFKDYRAFLLSINKLLIVPILLIFLINWLQNLGVFSISDTAFQVIILQAGMPCMIVVSIIAKELGYDENRAITNIFVSTMLSIISLPFLFYVMNTYIL